MIAARRQPDGRSVGGTQLTADQQPSEAAVPRRGNFVARHWRGELSLPVAYWAVAFVGSLVALTAFVIIDSLFLLRSQYDPYAALYAVALAWIVSLAVSLWQLVGVWRSAGRYQAARRAEGRRGFWGAAARLAVIAGWVRVAVQLWNGAVPQMTELVRMAYFGDPDIPAFNLRLMSSGAEVELTGGFKFGLTDAFLELLAGAPGLRTVHLNSDGGRIGEATKLFDAIRERGLDTYVSNVCASACTVAFAAGRQRWILAHSRLGYHAGSFPGVAVIADRELAAVYARAGIAEAFIDRILATPNESIWFPTLAELQRANVITGLARLGQFGAGADELALQAEVEAINRGLPRAADPVTTLDKVTLSGRDWVYHYTVRVGRADVSGESERELREGVLASTCASGSRRPPIREAGFSYTYRYSFAGGGEPLTVRVDESACARAAR